MKLTRDSIVTLFLQQCNSYTQQLNALSHILDPGTAYIAIDAEWANHTAWVKGFANWLQSASLVTFNSNGVWYWHLFLFTSTNIPASRRLMIEQVFGELPLVTLVWQELPEHATVIEQWLEDEQLSPDRVELIGKYSPLDYHAFFGHELWLDEMVDGGLVTQKRCLRFDVDKSRKGKRCYKPRTLNHYYSLRDLQGLNTGSLRKQGESVGVKLFAKDLGGKYVRGRMHLGYRRRTLQSTVYNICDTFAAMQISLAYVPLVNDIIDTLGLPESERITLASLPHTTGSLVGRVFCSFVDNYPRILAKHEKWTISETELVVLCDKWRLALWRHPLKSDRLQTQENRLADAILHGQQACKTIEQYREYEIIVGTGKKAKVRTLYDVILDTRLMRHLFSSSLYEQACARVLGSNTDSSSVFSALVQGGRCNNSCPFETNVQRVFDLDMNSCYGSTLRKLIYPIGLPTVYSRSLKHGEKTELWSKVYPKLKSELVNDLWCADASTNSTLTFSQDLLFSSYGLTPESIRKSVTGTVHYDDLDTDSPETVADVKKIPSEFVLTRKQLEHARICSSSQRVIERVATDNEKGELNKKIVCNAVVYYPKSKEFTDLEAFVDHMLSDRGKVTTDDENNVTDKRTRAWFGIKLEYFIGVLVGQRKQLKRDMQKAKDVGNKSLADLLNAKQEMFKLFINTLYGDLASVYFSFGNVVLANVITDKARVGAWMMSKALRTRMEITDGGFYSPLLVAYFSGKRPGLDVLSDWRKWKCLRSVDDIDRSFGCLGGWSVEQWEEYFTTYNRRVVNEEDTSDLDLVADTLAAQHIENFWKPYGLRFEFGVEHKYEHISWRAGYMSKSDYCLKTLGNQPDVIKKRGSRPANAEVPLDERDDDYYASIDPGFELLQALADADTRAYNHRGFVNKRLTNVGEYQEARVDKVIPVNPVTLAEHKAAGLVVPGWELVQKREPRQINNGFIYLSTYDDYDSINRRKSFDHGVRQQFFERFVNDVDKFTKEVSDNTLNISQAERNRNRTKTSKKAQA
jgi:hypothetical protein